MPRLFPTRDARKAFNAQQEPCDLQRVLVASKHITAIAKFVALAAIEIPTAVGIAVRAIVYDLSGVVAMIWAVGPLAPLKFDVTRNK